MNLLDIYVSNITYTSEPDEDGWVWVVCDTDCWGAKETQVKKFLSPSQYRSVVEKGSYLG